MEEQELEQAQLVLLTQAGHDRLKAELNRLTVEKRQEIAQRIRDSKDHGEFSEDNSELDEVKLEQAIVESRINELKNVLSGAGILTEKDIPTDHVGLGSVVTVTDSERDVTFTVRIVASVEADPDSDLISAESPLGQAVGGLEVGAVASFEAPAGLLHYKVEKISK